MSVNSEIQRISSAVADAYDAVDDMGGTLPSSQVVANLANAIKTIPQSGGSAVVVTEETDSHGGTIKHISAVELTNDTVTAAHLEAGYTAHDRFGNPITGILSPGGGTIWQDSNGYVHLGSEGSSGSSGLEYESGTWTQSEDASGTSISFTNTHSSAPFFIHIIDTGDITSASTNSLWYQYVVNWVGLMGASLNSKYGELRLGYKTSSGTNASTANLSSQATLEYYVSASRFTAGNGAYYVRTGRTYKWIAIWAPTS